MSGAQREFKGAVFVAGMKSVVIFMAHQPNRNHQPVAADFRYQVVLRIQCQSKKLKGSTLWKVLLKLSANRHDFLRRTRISQQAQQQVNRFGERRQGRGPA